MFHIREFHHTFLLLWRKSHRSNIPADLQLLGPYNVAPQVAERTRLTAALEWLRWRLEHDVTWQLVDGQDHNMHVMSGYSLE
jgi:hypothetical protein